MSVILEGGVTRAMSCNPVLIEKFFFLFSGADLILLLSSPAYGITSSDSENFLWRPFGHIVASFSFLAPLYIYIYITIIEQIKQSNMTIERKKEILRAREMFWQSRLSTSQPNGLNERMG